MVKKLVKKKKLLKKKPLKKKILLKRSIKTDKQIKLTKLIVENVGREKPLTREQMLKKAGYSDATAHNQAVFKSPVIKKAKDDVLANLIKIRDAAIKRALTLTDTALYPELVRSIDVMTKQVELLSGRPTSREENSLNPEDKSMLEDILYDNK